SVRDAATVLNAICGHDRRDSTSANVEVPDFRRALDSNRSDPLRGLRIGVPKEYLPPTLEPAMRDAFLKAVDTVKNLGAEIDFEMSLPSTDAALAVYYVLAPSEASANLARYDGVKYGFGYQKGASMWENMEQTRELGFGDEVKRRIMIGTYALSAGYYDA